MINGDGRRALRRNNDIAFADDEVPAFVADVFRAAGGAQLIRGQTVLLPATVIYFHGDNAFFTKPSGIQALSVVYLSTRVISCFIAVIAECRRI
jgi:hypothetical protein